jgi:hypothetical protein
MLRRARNFCFGVVVITSSLLASNPPQPENTATNKVAAEIQRLQKLAKAQSNNEPDWQDLEPTVNRLLARAEQGIKTGHLYAALDDAGKARIYLESYLTAKTSADAATMPAFENAWKKASADLVAVDNSAQQRVWTAKPVVQQALAESAQGQTLTLVEASRAYATVTNTHAGYYYVGEARTNAAFASFVYSLPLPATGARFRLRSWLPELQSLQKKVNAQFIPPKSIDRHAEFIRLNSTIKLANELDAAKLYAGALYQYLSAVQQFTAMNTDPPEGSNQALQKKLEIWKGKFKTSKRDDSIAELFVQRAELWTEHAAGSPLPANEWNAAASVVSGVLPAYEAALSAVPQVEQKTARLVTVTLVRWPYT